MNLRLTSVAALACFLVSLSLHAVVAGNGWLGAGIGALLVVAATGMLTRVASVPAAIAATFLVLIGVIPLLAGPGWAERIAGLVIVLLAALGATGTRLLRAFAIGLTYLSGLLIYLNLVFASQAAYGWIVPSRASVAALGRLASSAFVDFKYAPPVQDYRGVSLVTAAGIGLVAALVDLLAVRLRRPAVAGLPLLLLFSVPVASDLKTFSALQMVTFAAGLAGYLALLSADGRQRLRMWGRLVTFRHVQSADETGSGPDTRELAASGRRIGLAAICLAVIVPLVLPSVRAHDVFGTTDDGGPGGTLVVQDNPLADTQRALDGPPTPVLTYTTSSVNPHLQYLQQYVMNYSAASDSWTTLPAGSVLAPTGSKLPWRPPGSPASAVTTPVVTTIQLGANQSGEAVLPAPYAPVDLIVTGSSWQEAADSLMIFSVSASPANLRYTIDSQEPDPTAAEISNLPAPASITQEYDSYTGPDANELQEIANSVTAGASTQLQAALDLQTWFTSGHFTYTVKPNLPAKNWLLPFLKTDRKGLCTQFAQAFAVLARLVGIPSRVAVGFTGGTYSGGVWRVTSADAHAWPELYFSGDGWLRFEPTPGGQNGQGTAYLPAYASGGSGTTGPVGPGRVAPTAPTTAPSLHPSKVTGNNRFSKYGYNPSNPGGGHVRASGLDFAIGIPALLFLLIVWPALTRLLIRRRRWLSASSDAERARAGWRELTDDLTDYGLSGAPSETPRALTRRVAAAAKLGPAAVQAINRLGAAEECARYARSAQPGGGLAADVRTVRRAMAGSVTRAQRFRARYWPASTLQAAGRLMQRAGDGLRWLEAPVPAMRRQLQEALHRSG